jgi:hypothetical protein
MNGVWCKVRDLRRPGNDVVPARDGVRDLIACGAGRDTAYVDRYDRVSGCEIVRRK